MDVRGPQQWGVGSVGSSEALPTIMCALTPLMPKELVPARVLLAPRTAPASIEASCELSFLGLTAVEPILVCNT